MEKTLKDFKTECVLLSRLKHRNIIALVGATTHPVTCVMQYCSRGNLMVLLDDRRYVCGGGGDGVVVVVFVIVVAVVDDFHN